MPFFSIIIFLLTEKNLAWEYNKTFPINDLILNKYKQIKCSTKGGRV